MGFNSVFKGLTEADAALVAMQQPQLC